MQASSTQRPADHRLAATALLAAAMFVFGALLGGIAGRAAVALPAPVAAPAAAPAAGSGPIDVNAAWFRMHRYGEIGASTNVPDGSLRTQRNVDDYHGK